MKAGIAIIATFLITCCLAAWKPQPANAEPLAEETADAIDKEIAIQLQSILDESVASQGIPGAVMHISTPDGTWIGASGVANLKTKTPLKPRDRFRIASMSKMFVATVVLQLWEETKLSLDDTIADWLSEEIAERLPNSDAITIRQLLNHTSGLEDYLSTDGYAEAIATTEASHVWTPAEAIEYAFDLEPVGEPGEKHYYSNTNYILLELIVQAATGNILAQEIRDRILTPLQLNDTFTEMRENIPGGFVHGYSDWDGDGKRDDVTRKNDGFGLGDGGLVSTASDVARFAQALFANEELLEPETLEQMLTYVDDGEGDRYGLGVSAWESAWGEAFGHGGRSGGFLSTSWYLWDEEVTVVVLANDADNADPDAIAESALTVVLGEGE